MNLFLYFLLTHDCKPANGSNNHIKFEDDTKVISLIKDSDEAANREVDRLNGATTMGCSTQRRPRNSLWRNDDLHTPIHIKGMVVERVDNFKLPRLHFSEDLIWMTSCSMLVKKAHQHLFILRTLRKNHLSSDIMVNFDHSTIESILTNFITVWYGSCSRHCKRLVKAAQYIAGAPLPALKDI